MGNEGHGWIVERTMGREERVMALALLASRVPFNFGINVFAVPRDNANGLFKDCCCF